METYKLVNPVIQGTMQTSFEGKHAVDAAGRAYDAIAEHLSNNMPHFSFTLQRGGKYYHFNATEKANSEGKVKTEVRQITAKTEEGLSNFINNPQRGGGKRRKYRYEDDSDSDSSDDDSSDYRYYRPMPRRTAIDYWYYYPYIYKYDYLYSPLFVRELNPYVEIVLKAEVKP